MWHVLRLILEPNSSMALTSGKVLQLMNVVISHRWRCTTRTNSIGLITPDTQWQTFNTQRARLTTQHLSCHLVQSRSLSFICRFLSTFSQSLWLWGGLNDKKHTHKNSRVTQLESLFLWLTWAMCYLKDTWIMKHHWVFSSKGWSDATTVLSMKYWGGKKNRFTCHAGLH